MAEVEVKIPKDLGLTKTQISELQKSFKKQIVEMLKGKKTSSKAKSKQMVVDVRAVSVPKNQVV